MKKLLLSAVLSVSFVIAGRASSDGAVQPDEAALAARIPEVVSASAAHYRALLKAMEPEGPDKFPKRFQNGKLVTIRPKDWCSGFFPGSLWYLHELTGEAFWREQAAAYTERLIEPLRHDANNHDVGFRTYCSAGNALRITGDRRYAEFLHDTAAALRTRYDPKLGLIRSWNSKGGRRYDPNYMVIVDNMMNLELLEWDAKNGGSPESDVISRSQADITDRHHFRPDGSAYHVISYDDTNGKIQSIYAGQGACVEGTWSRGQSWAIYGYTVMYRETKDPRYLARAIRCSNYWLDEPNLPADGIPYWDFKASNIPNEERDVSAGCVAASAFLELSGYAPGDVGARYRAAAVKMLTALVSGGYYARPGENGDFLLMHSVGSKPSGGEVDVPLNYADYYFLEALLRFKALSAKTDVAKVGVDARHVPERMDDFFFENGFAAFRVYGPKLARPKPEGQGFSSNGIDVFNKGVADVCGVETVLDGMKNRKSYHADNGRCFDPYTVGPGCGCGGIRRRSASGEWMADGNWKSQRVIEKTATRAVFELEYATYTLRGTVTADSPFVRFDVTPKSATGALWGPGIDVAPSRKHMGAQFMDLDRGVLANAETDSGTMTAVVVDPSAGPVQIASDPSGCVYLLVAEKPFTCYIAAAWRGMGVFPSAESWFARVRTFADGLKKRSAR